jgi:fluoroquinolone transport system ATP-binding protein
MISVKDLRFTYPKANTEMLKGIDFSIAKGEVFGFLGPSGAGKSTTQKILFKLLNTYQGSAIIDNSEVKSWDKDLYKKIGVSFELPNHYLKLTALENLNFFGSFYSNTRSPHDLLDKVGLGNDARKKVSEYSKGMKVRLNFVRSLLHNPDILFLDEPTSGLDPVNARIVKNIIKEEQEKGKTIFVTTHQMQDAEELCDRVAFIVDGEIKALDSPKNLKQKHSHHAVDVTFRNEKEPLTFPLESLGSNPEFLTKLQSDDILTIHSKEASLDEVFIKVTGTSLL